MKITFWKILIFINVLIVSSLYADEEKSDLLLNEFLLENSPSQPLIIKNIPYRISWCSLEITPTIQENYNKLKEILAKRTTLMLPENLLKNACEVGLAEIWWMDEEIFKKFDYSKIKKHISNGGIFIIEGMKNPDLETNLFMDHSLGIDLESPEKNGMFYRSFYLLQNLDGCLPDKTKVLMLRKRINAQVPIGIYINTHFLTNGKDCFYNNEDYKLRSFINIIFSFITTDYKEDQRELPEILNRIRNLGLKP